MSEVTDREMLDRDDRIQSQNMREVAINVAGKLFAPASPNQLINHADTIYQYILAGKQ